MRASSFTKLFAVAIQSFISIGGRFVVADKCEFAQALGNSSILEHAFSAL